MGFLTIVCKKQKKQKNEINLQIVFNWKLNYINTSLTARIREGKKMFLWRFVTHSRRPELLRNWHSVRLLWTIYNYVTIIILYEPELVTFVRFSGFACLPRQTNETELTRAPSYINMPCTMFYYYVYLRVYKVCTRNGRVLQYTYRSSHAYVLLYNLPRSPCSPPAPSGALPLAAANPFPYTPPHFFPFAHYSLLIIFGLGVNIRAQYNNNNII